jgi:hypothetical protein
VVELFRLARSIIDRARRRPALDRLARA